MGQSQSIGWQDELTIDNTEWQQIKFQPNRRILQNTKTNIEAQYQVIQIDPQYSVQRQMEIYYYRKLQENALVTVYGAGHVKNSEAPLCGNTETMKVLYERIPRRLFELPQLILPQALYVLSEALRGFKDCYQKAGLFEVTDAMIGVNNDGEVRVWLNQNFALNHPQLQRPVLQITSTYEYQQAAEQQQKVMVDNVLRVVEAKTQQGYFPEEFKTRIYKQSNFVDAYCEIQNYINSRNLWIPDRLPSNSLLIQHRRQSKIEDFSTYLHEKAENQRISSTSEPHATYIPNVQYSYPRVTYLQVPYSPHSSSSDHVKPRRVQVTFPNSPQSNPGLCFNTDSKVRANQWQYGSIEDKRVASERRVVPQTQGINYQIHHLKHPKDHHEPLRIKPYTHHS